MPSLTIKKLIEDARQAIKNQDYKGGYTTSLEAKKKLLKGKESLSCFREYGAELIDIFLGLADITEYKLSNTQWSLDCSFHAEEIHLAGWKTPDDTLIKINDYLGYSLNRLYRFQEAIDKYEYLISITDDTDGTMRMTAYYGIGLAYDEMGDWENSLHYYLQAERELSKVDKGVPEYNSSLAALHNNLCSLYIRIGNYETAIERGNACIGLLPTSHPNLFFPLINLGTAYLEKEVYHKALDYFQQAESVAQKNLDQQLRSLYSFIKYYHATGDIKQAKKNIQLLDNLDEEYQQWHAYLPRAYFKAAQIFFSEGNKEKSLRFIDKAIELAHAEQWKIEALNFKADMLLADKELEESLALICTIDNSIDEIRRSYKTYEYKLLLAEQAKDIYEKGIGIAHSLYKETQQAKYLQTTFYFAEKSKSILLLHEVQHQNAITSTGIPDELQKKEQDFLFRLNVLNTILRKNLTDEVKKNYQQEQFELNSEFDNFIRELEQQYPDYYQLKYNTAPVSIEVLQKHLQKGQLLVSYFIGEKRTYYFKISSHTRDMGDLGESSSLVDNISAFNKLVINIRTKPHHYQKKAYLLYEKLIAPVVKNERVTELIVCPDGEFAKLPFEALCTAEYTDTVDFHVLPYLIRNYEIRYHFSTTLWQHGLNKQYLPDKYQHDFAGFAPTYDGEISEHQNRGGYYSTYRDSNGICYELPFAKEEVRNISGLFSTKKTSIYINSQASKEAFINNSPKTKYLHVAAHGFYKEDSYIQFSSSEDKDTRLTVGDIQILRLSAFLVVLSCCNTALGQYRKGESMLALNRGFLAAGAQNVISTIFKVPDKLAAQLMTDFYQLHLNDSQHIGTALRQAKLNLIANKDVTPMAWSGYQLIGE